MKEIARVSEIWRYPVKSMAGESIEKSDVYWYGLEGDRRYGFVQNGHPGSFPWLTAREIPQIVKFQPRLIGNDLVHGPVEVTTPAGETFPIGDERLRQALLAHRSGFDAHLMQLNRGTFDAAPVSLMSLATIRQVDQTFGQSLDTRRYRQNLIIETIEDKPYIEDSWCEQIIRFGDRPDSAQVLLNRPIQRCQMINVDPDHGQVDAGVLKAVVRSRDNCLGVYAAVVRPGTIYAGDSIYQL
ncbi:MAG: MOSC domain-containing protein [Ardenticatenaceae bacterium]|nr:MOSC domain-containing protein [Ardenticatenaceae bacterium]